MGGSSVSSTDNKFTWLENNPHRACCQRVSLTQGEQSDGADPLKLRRHTVDIVRLPQLPIQHNACSNGQERIRDVDQEQLIGDPTKWARKKMQWSWGHVTIIKSGLIQEDEQTLHFTGISALEVFPQPRALRRRRFLRTFPSHTKNVDNFTEASRGCTG